MLVYSRFAKAPWHWHPRDVDRLSREELFWLPVILEAEQDAAEQLAPSD